MCLFRVESKTTAGAPAVMPRQDRDTALPTAKPTKDADKVASVKFGGGSKKDQNSAAANRTGTDALTINLNQNQGGNTTGGVNV